METRGQHERGPDGPRDCAHTDQLEVVTRGNRRRGRRRIRQSHHPRRRLFRLRRSQAPDSGGRLHRPKLPTIADHHVDGAIWPHRVGPGRTGTWPQCSTAGIGAAFGGAKPPGQCGGSARGQHAFGDVSSRPGQTCDHTVPSGAGKATTQTGGASFRAGSATNANIGTTVSSRSASYFAALSSEFCENLNRRRRTWLAKASWWRRRLGSNRSKHRSRPSPQRKRREPTHAG